MRGVFKILIGLGVLLIALVVAGVVMMKSMDFNQYRGLIAEQVKSATGRELSITGDLDLRISLSPSIAVNGVTFANAPWGSDPQMIIMDSFAAEVALLPLISGDIQVKRVVLEGVSVLLETRSDGTANWTFEGAGEPSQDAGTSDGGALPVVHSVQVRDVTLRYRDGQSGETQDVSIDAIDLSASGISDPMKLFVEATYNGELLKASGELGSIESLSENRVFPLQLSVEAIGTAIELDGTVGKPREGKSFNIGFKASGDDIAAVAVRGMKLAGIEGDTPLASSAFSIAGALRDEGHALSIDGLALKLGGSDLAGNATINMAGNRPDLNAALSSEIFTLADVLAEGSADATTPAADAADDGRVFPADPLALDGLKAVDAALAFNGKSVTAQGVTLVDVAVELVLKNGRLVVSPFGMNFGGGRVGGDITLDASSSPAKLSLAVDVAQIDYGQLLKDMTGESAITGKADITLQSRGTGTSVRALMASLDGKLRFVSEEGYIDSGALSFVTGELVPLFDSEDAKTLRCAVVDFDIVKGMATSKATVIETGGLSILGEGGIDLREEKLNLHFDPTAKNTSLVSAAEIGIVVGGTLKEPSFGPDMGDVAMGVASTAAGIATGGLSTVIGMAVDATVSTVDNTDYCAQALAGKPLKADAQPASSDGATSTQSSEPDQPAPTQGSETLQGIGGAIDSLFGN